MSKQELTEQQGELLAFVTRADAEWRATKRTAMDEARRLAAKRIQQSLELRDHAVRMAVEAGLPLIELRRKHQGLHTTNANTVLDSLARTEDLGLAA